MKLGIFGYGKMGKAIEQIAERQGIEIVWRIRRDDLTTLTPDLLRQADVAIEFTQPAVAFENVMHCLRAGVPVVSGTTGWLERLPEAQQFCLEQKGAMLWASNFSVGVNLFFCAEPPACPVDGRQTRIRRFPHRDPSHPQTGCTKRYRPYAGERADSKRWPV